VAASSRSIELSDIRVLIVDDDVPTRVGLQTILSAEPDIEVVGEASTGLEACDLAAKLRPDIVLMDVQLPDLDGIEATRRITAATDENGEVRTRVVVLTTYDIDEYAYESLRAGASGFLLKRTRAEALVDAVRAVAGGDALSMPRATERLIASVATVEPERHSAAFESLTDRESEVLVLAARGLSNVEIAEELGVSIQTIKTHLKHVYMKIGARDRVQAVIAAYEHGLVTRHGV
jgi:DNA-binding NarL/FixJ family response regulator